MPLSYPNYHSVTEPVVLKVGHCRRAAMTFEALMGQIIEDRSAVSAVEVRAQKQHTG